MVALIRQPSLAFGGLLQRWREAVVLMLWLVAAVVVVRSFLGDSSSPYGVCYGPSGRSIPCALAKPGP